MKEEIEVGDIVRVIDSGKMYNTYQDWIEKHAPKFLELWKYKDSYIDKKADYIVLNKAPHETPIFDTLYLIQDINSKQVYIIGEKGIKLVTAEHKTESCIAPAQPVDDINLRFEGIL
jgi:hypothetical protein